MATMWYANCTRGDLNTSKNPTSKAGAENYKKLHQAAKPGHPVMILSKEVNTAINSNGGVGTTPYGPPLPTTSRGITCPTCGQQFSTADSAERHIASAHRAPAGGGSSGGSSSGSSSSSPSIPLPYNVAINNGISHGEMNTFLSKAVASFNKENGTNFQLNSQGHIRAGGTGSYMTATQQNSFNASIPVNAVSYKYDLAIDKAIGGNPTDLRNLDKFFTGSYGPDIRYTPEWTRKEKEAKALGISMEELDRRNAAPAPVVSTGTPIAPPVREPDTIDKQEQEKTAKAEDDKKEAEEKAKVAAAKAEDDQREKEEQAKIASEQAEERRKDAEAHAKAAAAQADADEKQQQALAVATANKQSAKEARLKKIMEMRKPWTSGAASVQGSSDAMVVPPIVPASQVPPPPIP